MFGNRLWVLYLISGFLLGCQPEKFREAGSENTGSTFQPSDYGLQDNPVKLVRGQVLYLPVYSNIPYSLDSVKFDMSAFLAVHNTDFRQPVRIKRIQFFNSKGRMVKEYTETPARQLGPLETADFYVPYSDKSGTGANFLIEWESDSLVTEPLIESVTINLNSPNSLAVLSTGKVLRERR
ncbi:MAG: DUF3124 domain-containing protein [Bacteroidetes bacterium]|nr:DUF3124 domain-containing protein [Bacteroidota bacterium]